MSDGEPLIEGRLLHRYKRFLVDVELPDGRIVTAHCPNSGSLKGCLGEGWPVRLSDNPSPKRKLRYGWEAVHNGTCWIGINTHRANTLAADAVAAGRIHELSRPDRVLREVRAGDSRLDLVAVTGNRLSWIEVKNVTLIGEDGRFAFPDAPTQRGRKHLLALDKLRRLGHDAAMLYAIRRTDADSFSPADEIDAEYGSLLRRVASEGVRVLAYGVDGAGTSAETLVRPIPVVL